MLKERKGVTYEKENLFKNGFRNYITSDDWY